MPLLSDPRPRSRVRRHRRPERRAGGNQPVAQRLQRRHSGFWLLTSDFHIPAGDIKGASPCLVSADGVVVLGVVANLGTSEVSSRYCTKFSTSILKDRGRRRLPQTQWRERRDAES